MRQADQQLRVAHHALALEDRRQQLFLDVDHDQGGLVGRQGSFSDPKLVFSPSERSVQPSEIRFGLGATSLLTVTLASGMLFSEQIFGRPIPFTHKSVFSLLGWLTFAALLWGRWRYGWRGRVALRWIVAGTVFVFLAYLGEKFVLEVLLGR